MGNKIGRWRSSVDEKFTKPQGLYDHGNVDHKRLRKLILDAKLAPCYPGGEERSPDLEECPICFLNYPSLNRSTCCAKGICTECFLQMQPPYSNRPTQCPFCKTLFYAVDYRGAMTKEEKGMEQLEEQRIIEAQIRMRQQELNDEKQESQKRQGSNSSVPSSRLQEQPDSRCNLLPDPLPAPASRLSSHSRENNVDVDLEDIMIMEAIWLSIQEQGDQSYPTCGHSLPGVHSDTMSLVSRGTPSAGLACAVAALAEDQYSIRPPALNTSQQLDRICVPASSSGRCINGTSERRTTRMEEGDIQALDHDSSVIAEAGTSYSSANVKVEGVNMASNHFLPVNFEEQMMLAMAMSIADTEHGQITKD